VALPHFLLRLLVRSGVARYLPFVQRRTCGAGPFLRYYADRLLAAPWEELRDMAGLAEPRGPDVIDLADGSPRFDLVPSGSTKLPADRRGWPPPWGLPELRAAVADKLHADHGLDANPADEVLVTAGVAGAFSAVLDAFINPGDGVALFEPTSPLYRFGIRHRRARVRWVPSRVEDGRLRFHAQDLVKALSRSRLIVVNSPANPTGGVLAPEDLEQIAWWANRRDVLIFDDQAFERFHYARHAVSIGTLPAARRRKLTAGSVSKGHALSSARVGWLAGCKHLVRPCAVTAALQASLVPALCQQVAHAALQQGEEPFRPVREEFDARRHYAFERLQALGLQPAWPAGAFFFWIPVWELGLSGRVFADRLLRSQRVLVCPGEHFGPSGIGYVRLSYAVDDGRFREGLARLGEFLRELEGAQQAVATRQAA
jgi:aspartate/methionine/tyrosine aminotransferase